MPLPEPVLVRYVDNVELYVMHVHPMEDQLFAYVEGNCYEHVGHVEKIHTIHRGLEVDEWEAHSLVGKPVHDRSRAGAVKKLLETLGCYPVKGIQTIPRLF